MIRTDLIVLISLYWGILQGSLAEECETYQQSGVKGYCYAIEIENGQACYIDLPYAKWEAKITCDEGFILNGASSQLCKSRHTNGAWGWNDAITTCVPVTTTTTTSTTSSTTTTTTTTTRTSPISTSPSTETTPQGILEHKGDKPLAVYIAVPLVVLVLLVSGGLLLWFLYRRRQRETSHNNVHRKENVASTETNKTYGVPAVSTDCIPATSDEENSNSEYVEIQDVDEHTTGDNEYNTLHTNEKRDFHGSDYNHVPVQPEPDAYNHTTDIIVNAKADSEPYSHLNDAHQSPVDPSYNHVGIRSDLTAGIDLETYTNVGIKESNDYFVLEKTE